MKTKLAGKILDCIESELEVTNYNAVIRVDKVLDKILKIKGLPRDTLEKTISVYHSIDEAIIEKYPHEPVDKKFYTD